MHAYATDSPAHPKLFWVLSVMAIVLSSGVGWLLGWVKTAFGWSVAGVSALTCFTILYFVFDRYLWRLAWIRKLLLVPDLNGTWRVTGRTVSEAGEPAARAWDGKLRIRQSWSRISACLTTQQSTSSSIAASLFGHPPDNFRLIYHYDNQPGTAEGNLARHTGLCRIVFDAAGSAGEGNYFTDRDRLTVGTMSLVREGKHGTS